MRARRAASAFAGVFLVLVLLVLTRPGDRDDGSALRTTDDGPVSAVTAFAQPAAGGEPRRFSRAEARAYAWLGRRADGGDAGALDAAAAAHLEAMRALLAAQERRPGAGLPTVTPRGVRQIVPPDGRPVDPAAIQEAVTGLRHAGGEDDGAAGGVPPEEPEVGEAGSDPPPVGPDGARARDRSQGYQLVERPGTVAVVDDAAAHVAVRGEGVWAALPQLEGRERLQIDAAGAYAIAIDGPEVDRARLDGGLVVPGRFYRLGDSRTITGAAGIEVLIRPLAAVPSYHPEPAVLGPEGDG